MKHNKCPKCEHYENEAFRFCPVCGAGPFDADPPPSCSTCGKALEWHGQQLPACEPGYWACPVHGEQ